MKIIMDVSCLANARLSGIGVYVTQLSEALSRRGLNVVGCYRSSRFSKRHLISEHWKFPLQPSLLNGFSRSICHGPDYTLPFRSWGPQLITIHDLAFLRPDMTSSDFASRCRRKLESVLKSDQLKAIICISDSTIKDLRHFYPEVASRAHRIYLGIDHLKASLKDRAPALNQGVAVSEKPFILSVGYIEQRKNISGMLKGFETYCQAHSADKDLQWILLGRLGYKGEQLRREIEESPFSNRILIRDHVSTNELSQYYSSSEGLLHCSWVEGFGLPVGEAIASNCPVITSSTTATAEVVGSLGLLVDPASPSDIAESIACLRKNPSLRDSSEFKKSCQNRLDQFTWSKCAEQTEDIYRRLDQN